MTTLTLTNRSDSAITPEWIHIVPRGELPNPAAGVTQILDDAAIDAILANINSDRARLGEKWPGIYLGKEHHIYDPDQDSAALGWLKNFKVNAAGLWASTDGLTPIGKQAIADKLYKFTSFTAKRDQVQSLDGDKVRILRIHTVGLTNNPNGAELLTPISNREAAGSQKSEAGSQQPEDSGFALADDPIITNTFDPAQPRDEDGQWTDGPTDAPKVKMTIQTAAAKLRETGWELGPAEPWKPGDKETIYTVTHAKTGKVVKKTAKEIMRKLAPAKKNAAPALSNRLPDPAVLPHPNPLPLGEGTGTTTTNTISVSQPQPTPNNMELAELKNRASALEAEIATLKTENSTLKNRLQETESEQIAGLLDQHGVKTEPARAALLPVLLELRNRAERVQWLANVLPPAAAPAPAPSAPSAPAKPLTNRAAAGIPAAAPGSTARRATREVWAANAPVPANS